MKQEEEDKTRQLTAVRARNNRLSWLIYDYMEDNPHALFAQQMQDMAIDNHKSESLFRTFFINYCKEIDKRDPEADDGITDGLERSLHCLDPQRYRSDPFYRDLTIPHIHSGNWELCEESYQPFEVFICDDIFLGDDLCEIPQTGFFTQPFSFPAVKENGREWMSVKPNEVETMRSAIAAAEGDVLVLGLGIGYFAYNVSLKENVSSVTVVERDETAIHLFEEYIFPQFAQKSKIRIIRSDAFDAVRKAQTEGYDYAFVDLWHDVSDGLPLYLKMKKIERYALHTRFAYWVEESLLSALRWKLFNVVVAHADSCDQIIRELGDANLRRYASI